MTDYKAAYKKWKDRINSDPVLKEIEREKSRLRGLKSFHKHREKRKAASKLWNANNRERCRSKKNAWHRANTPHVREYERNRRKDPLIRIRKQLGIRMSEVLSYSGKRKAEKTLSLLGCNVIQFKAWLESKFTIGMDWHNYGQFGWHIDHKKPCSSFDLTNPEQQKACFHYTNLQPLWWRDNLVKGDRISA